VDEWNYDRSANVLPDRQERSNVAASYIPSRIKNMYEAGINYQLYFSLEDFQNNSEGVVRNTGIFWLGPDAPAYKGGPKSMYNVFKMLSLLGNDMFSSSLKSNGEFVGVIATKSQEAIIILIYNYTDPDIVMGYLTKNIASLNNAERRILLNLVKTNKLQMLAQHKLDIATLRLSHRLKSLLKKATELNDKALKFSTEPRNLRINIKNLKENYLYQRYSICNQYCAFLPTEEKRLDAPDLYQETLTVSPYSVQIILLKKRPPEPEVVPEKPAEELKPEQPLPEKPAEQPAETPPAEKPIPQEPKHSETPKADSPS
jgi:hypothetical protein